MVIGSGPIIIGQAAEFDYAGCQAVKAIAEEGLVSVLVNSNPATIMTDPSMADRIYLEPLTIESLERVVERERPDGLIATLGAQVGLNLAVGLERAGVLERYGVKLLGTPLKGIQEAEDRDLFRALMLELGEPIPPSRNVSSIADGLAFAREVGYPLIVRPAFTLGGSGGGFAHTEEDLKAALGRALAVSPIGQCLVEESIRGWVEVEYEVMRDAADNVITVCNMENIDPVGVHTGDSIVVAPSLTLTDEQYQVLRSSSLRIIRALGVEGGCNVQLGLNPKTGEYRVIEVNPRVSRSSALASKATGYPIARMATKIALGYTLPELVNPVTGRTTACFEPAIDYVVMKIPRWPFDKFVGADRRLGTQMKATGEVMSIGRSFRESVQKAIRSLEVGSFGMLREKDRALTDDVLTSRLEDPDDDRLFLIAEAIRRGRSVNEVAEATGIRPFFIEEIAHLVMHETTLPDLDKVTPALMRHLKREGFADRRLADLWGVDESEVRRLRWGMDIHPVYKMVDTCAGEFEAATPYFYATYEEEDEALPREGAAVLVIGSGPIRIGQGIEFDFSTVHALKALREKGMRALIINSNPETVSTDFSESDRLFFEPVTLEDVLEVAHHERVKGVLTQLGGQTGLNLAAPLEAEGIPILGTPLTGIDAAEDRGLFDAMLKDLGISHPPGHAVRTVEEALLSAEETGYPVLVRPSFVLGGRAMEIVASEEDLLHYLKSAAEVSPERPVLIDEYVAGREVEVDAVADGRDVLVVGIMEHIERAGVHSGDSMAVYPTYSLPAATKDRIVEVTRRIAGAIGVKGLLNVQFVVKDDDVLVIEANPRASRTIPFLEKVAGCPAAEIATRVMAGDTLAALGVAPGLWPEPLHVGIKAPVFSWAKLARVDASLGPEMKSTGEVLGIDPTFEGALLKAFWASGFRLVEGASILLTVADRDKAEVAELAADIASRGYRLLATAGTAQALRKRGIEVLEVPRVGEGEGDILSLIRARQVDLVVNTLTRGQEPLRDGFRIRRAAVEHGVPCITSLDTAAAVMRALAFALTPRTLALQDYLGAVPAGGGTS